jgi:hypothetical protein
MCIEAVPNRNSPPATLLRESYRVDGKVKKRTLLNLSDWPTELIEGLHTLLKGGTALPPGVAGHIEGRMQSSSNGRCPTAMSPPCSAPCEGSASTGC